MANNETTTAEEAQRTFFSNEEILPILESSRQQFNDGRRVEYAIDSGPIVTALDKINNADDYAKVIWRVQQESPGDERYFDANYMAAAITNLKRFYALEVIDGRNLHALSKTLDPFWHAHQSFSFDYLNFCEDVFGPGQFLHHLPSDKRDKVKTQALKRRYAYTKTMLDKVFAVDEAFWSPGDVVPCCSYEADSPEKFVFWKPALIAKEPASSEPELRKTTNFALSGFSSPK